jgi:hypothetical protein
MQLRETETREGERREAMEGEGERGREGGREREREKERERRLHQSADMLCASQCSNNPPRSAYRARTHTHTHNRSRSGTVWRETCAAEAFPTAVGQVCGKPRDDSKKVERSVINKNVELRALGVMYVVVADNPDLVVVADNPDRRRRCGRDATKSRTTGVSQSGARETERDRETEGQRARICREIAQKRGRRMEGGRER